MQTFNKWLESARKSAGLTQGELARRAGCTRAYISSLERGVIEGASNEPIKPSLKIVDAIARGLGVPSQIPRRLAGYHAPAADGVSEIESQLLAYYREMTPDRQAIFLRLRVF